MSTTPEYRTNHNILALKVKTQSGHYGVSGKTKYLEEIADEHIFIHKAYANTEFSEL